MDTLTMPDLEAANSKNFDSDDDSYSCPDPFDVITTKNVPIEHLRRWRKAVVARNYFRRFRYTLDLQGHDEMKLKVAHYRSQAQNIIADHPWENNQQTSFCPCCNGSGIMIQAGNFGITQQALVFMTKNHSLSTLEKYGGVDGLAKLLNAHLQKGISGDYADLRDRKNAFESNYMDAPIPQHIDSLFCNVADIGLMALMIMGLAFIFSTTEELERDVSVAEMSIVGFMVAYALSFISMGFVDFQDLTQIKSQLLEKKIPNQLEVIRGGKRIALSMYDIVVGDVVPLEIGDQVPADGVITSSHSLAVDMLNLIGESKIVHKDFKSPFLMAGSEVTNGSGTMLVTSVGRNTIWTNLMATKHSHIIEETPLQVRLNGFSTFIARVGCIVSFIVFLALLLRFFAGYSTLNGDVEFKAGQTSGRIAFGVVIHILIDIIVMITLAIPEELPLNVTRMMVYSAGKSLADNLMVRRPSAFETMGCATTLCIDKSGIFTLTKDPYDKGLKDFVKACHVAGIKICLVTNDCLQNAKAISSECGILKPNANDSEPVLVEGPKFRSLSNIARQMIAKKILVMGCSSRNDKLLLVKALKNQGEVVAMIGSTSDDAPALNEANVGIAVGVKGSQCAKERSDVIIADDNSTSIIELIRCGRSIHANIKKCIQFQLTVITEALLINLLSAITWGDIQLKASQLLYVNFMVDLPGAFVFIAEPPTDDLMHKPPVGRREHLITRVMWRNLLIQISYQVAMLLSLKIWGQSLLSLDNDVITHANKVKDTVIFNSFFLCQIFNMLNARKPDKFNIFEGISCNKCFMWFIGLALILQVIIIFLLGDVFGTTKLNLMQWAISIMVAFGSWVLAVVGKLYPFNCSNRPVI